MLSMLQSSVYLPASAESAKYLRGDLNSDGKLDACDLTLLKHGLISGFESPSAQIADVNADGITDRNDAEMLRDNLLTKIDCFPEQYVIEPETPQIRPLSGSRQMEYLSRGVSAVSNGKGVFVSWRLLADDPADIAFNVYRTTDGKTVKVNDKPLTGGTNFTDSKADLKKDQTYRQGGHRRKGV